MIKIHKFKIFESNVDDIEYDQDDIDNCKDYIDSLQDFEDDYKISNIIKGWFSGSIQNRHENEGDKIALGFRISLKENSSYKDKLMGNFIETSIDNIDDTIKLINKCKSLILRFKKWNGTVLTHTHNKYVDFVITFKNKDTESIFNIKVKDNIEKIDKYLVDWRDSKRIQINRISSLSNIIPDIYKGGLGCEISYRASTDIKGNIISIKLYEFKYQKLYSGDKWKKFDPGQDILSQIINHIIEHKFKADYRTSSIFRENTIVADGNIIKIEIKK